MVCIFALSFGGCLGNAVESSHLVVNTTTDNAESTEMMTTTASATDITTSMSLTKATASTTKKSSTTDMKQVQTNYILNTNSMKFHKAGCYHATKIKAENRDEFTGGRQQVIDMGYSPCGTCKP